ncbi:hypothetical protein EMGBS8_15320 [Verrucomicrobiota bacterium]|nr:hypothetical protein EMGBS8_15320 [Verrucomicrobiota bacterium]
MPSRRVISERQTCAALRTFSAARAVAEFLRFALQELQVNANGVQGIADFMRDTRSEGDNGVNALAFNAVLGLHALSSDVAEDGNAAGTLRILRTTDACKVQAQHTRLGIADFDLTGQGFNRNGHVQGLSNIRRNAAQFRTIDGFFADA